MYSNSPRTAKETLDETAANAKNMANDAGKKVVEIKDDLNKIANNAGRTVRAYFDTASSEVTHAKDVVVEHVRTKPVQSSLIALGAGFILGALFRR